MAPKKSEAAFLADVTAHRQWVVANLAALRARRGRGLQARLRQLAGPEEKRVHNWYRHHRSAALVCPRVAAALSELGALAEESPGAAASASPREGPPAKQRRLAGSGGEPAGPAARPLTRESVPGLSTLAARWVAPTACATGQSPAAAAAKAPRASSPPIGNAESPAQRRRLAAGGVEATPARAAADPLERGPMGLTPDTAEALARSCRESPCESPLPDDYARPAFSAGICRSRRRDLPGAGPATARGGAPSGGGITESGDRSAHARP